MISAYPKQYMIDLETMAHPPQAAITSIAAVCFDITTGEVYGDAFHFHVSLDDCLRLGLKANASTITWWLKQSPEAREALVKGQEKAIKVVEALESLSHWFYCKEPDPARRIIWANSPQFDLAILKTAYARTSLNQPWAYYNERCVRTIANLRPEIKLQTPDVGTSHNALDDCIFQIEYLTRTLRSLGVC